MNNLCKDYILKFRLTDLTISTTDSWIISLRPHQITIGSLILTLNRQCSTMAALRLSETKDLLNAFKRIELMLKSAFNPDKLNYCR